MKILSDMAALLTGIWITWKHMFRRPETIQYPEEKRIPFPRYRARIVLTRDPEGGERCVACQLCSAACPVDCISMQPAEGEHGRRYAEWFRINFSRCIFCGLCAEACPTLAIQMTPDYEICTRDVMTLIYEKEDLLINLGVYGASADAWGPIADLWRFDHALLSGRMLPASSGRPWRGSTAARTAWP